MPTAEASHESNNFYYGQFSSKFRWGSTSSDIYPSDNSISDGSTTSDSHHKFEEDVMLLKAMNATCYKFSLSWSRILLDGTLNKINKAGIDYYDDLINTLLENGIEPIVVLYHWDLPQVLCQKYPNRWQDDNMIKAFGNYAQLCFKKFGDRVKRWVTIHDPWTHSEFGFGNGIHPRIQGCKTGTPFKVFKTLLKAHALAYRIYEKSYRRKQHGKVGISVNSKCISSGSSSNNQIEKAVPNISFMADRLPSFDPNPKDRHTMSNWWLEFTKTQSDFIDLNQEDVLSLQLSPPQCYNTQRRSPNNNDLHNVHSTSQQRKTITNTRDLLNVIKNDLGNPEVILCGKGLPLIGSHIGNLVDLDRIEYFKVHANEVLKSVILDECNVVGFLPGTLIDSYEYEHGFALSYGLHEVNFNHCDKPRKQRSSAKYLAHLFLMNGFSKDWDIGTILLN